MTGGTVSSIGRHMVLHLPHGGMIWGLGAHALMSWNGMPGMNWLQLGRMTSLENGPAGILVVHLVGNGWYRLPDKALISC